MNLRKTWLAMQVRKPYRALFCRYADNGFTENHPFYFLRRAKGVIHVGANTGQERDTYAFFRKSVIWIEPIPSVFGRLQQNVRDLKNQRAFKYLITDKDGNNYDFHVSNNDAVSSSIFDLALHRELWPEVHYTGTLKLTSTTLDSFMANEKIRARTYDTLIMDTQGSELLVLKGARKTLRTIKWVYTECANFAAYKDCCRCDDLSEYLNEAGFLEAKREPMISREGVGTYFNVLYRRQGFGRYVPRLIRLITNR